MPSSPRPRRRGPSQPAPILSPVWVARTTNPKPYASHPPRQLDPTSHAPRASHGRNLLLALHVRQRPSHDGARHEHAQQRLDDHPPDG